MEKYIISKKFKWIHFLKNKINKFVNVETDHIGYGTRSDKSDCMWTRKCTRTILELLESEGCTKCAWRSTWHKVAIEGPILLFIYLSIKHPNLCNQVTSQLLILLECWKSQLANRAPKIGTKSWSLAKFSLQNFTRVFSRTEPEGRSIAKLSNESELEKSTTHKICWTRTITFMQL